MDDFASLGLNESISQALTSFGFAGPTPVQKTSISLLLSGKDIFMESETGTGKTFAYLAPGIQLLAGRRFSEGPGLIVAAPTQELAVQIGKVAEKLMTASRVPGEVAVLLGGSPVSRQEVTLKHRPGVVIGTLGRLSDLVKMGALRLKGLGVMVFDEADRMLAPETNAEMLHLLQCVPPTCARVLVSATLPAKVRKAAMPYMRDPVSVSVSGEQVLAGTIEHWCLYCDARRRVDFVRRLEAAVHPIRCLVFMAQAARVQNAEERISAMGLPVASISARMDKEARRVALERFTKGEIRYLVTSDLGARGLDIPNISHILSLDLPEEPTIYTHRAGRTGRAGAKGVSIILADKIEIERASKMAVRAGFKFRCKILEGAKVLEPTTEEFFRLVEDAWDEKSKYRATRPSWGAPADHPASNYQDRRPADRAGTDSRRPDPRRPGGPTGDR